jgi:hypothetical protein
VIELDFPSGKGPSAYWVLIGALERLLDNEPTHPDLVALKEELASQDPPDRIRVTQLNVALEAGKKRDYISGENATFKKLAAYIKSLRPTHGVVRNTTEKLKKQAADIVWLEQRITVLRSKVAAYVVQNEALRLDLEEAKSDLERFRSKTTVA